MNPRLAFALASLFAGALSAPHAGHDGNKDPSIGDAKFETLEDAREYAIARNQQHRDMAYCVAESQTCEWTEFSVEVESDDKTDDKRNEKKDQDQDYFTVKTSTRTAMCKVGQCSVTASGKSRCDLSFSRGGYPSGTCY
ncbi:hypothetical protein PCL_01507 [Purpureocillium lilacinum]|uniref:Uncharacterized protein n=2 Tax=Purpureocillium lilacinum TaxID=33203 RepID=A0A179GWE8_PURLI|nr:hypothetical protein VFPBJ_04676 [Purpureocillium lilacinum]PWI69122.1 hypothetical protein PCL_01507 [Purpureocillium lilacinum]